MDGMYAERIARTLPQVRRSIAEAAGQAGRAPSEVRLVAVTKGHPIEAITAALAAGLSDFGENRIEELEDKVGHLGRGPHRWHMIGHVQGRKAQRAVRAADLIHSVDSYRLAERLSRAASEDPAGTVSVLLQVNTSGEESKGGFSAPDGLEPLLHAAELPGLRVEGLMTMAPYTDDEAVLRSTFRGLRQLLDALRQARPEIGHELSMGMSNDLRIAIEEGSTMVRIGTALFGERTPTGE